MTQVEGRNPVYETLKRGGVKKLLVATGSEKGKRIQEILELARKKKVEVEFVRRPHLNSISKTRRHQGVIAISETPGYASLKAILEKTKGEVCIVILDGVQDPQNLGSILRTSDAAGVDAVVIPRKESVGLTPTVIRVSMGGGVSVPVARENLYPSVKLLRDEGVRLVCVDPLGTVNYWDMDLTGSVAFVFGGEDRGISPTLLGKCNSIMRIPMTGSIKNLNVGVSAALVLYERLRQKNKKI
ncbi:MAG: 23S rRNA (guanosine(2251)-2'-O)-methyltransferase RlmB [Promethearchaeota archaeon]|jgi:23S rRNA (guanosine2251-2'-O)-methyltransferase